MKHRLFKKLPPWLPLCALAPGLGAFYSYNALSSGFPVEFESRESLTKEGGPVINRIRMEKQGVNDIWIMQQSHSGAGLPHPAWDKLAIVVNQEQKTARFYQLAPGALSWSGREKELPFKVACYLCHANGPRAIRPNFASSTHPLGLKERLIIKAWNRRIRSYGALLPHEETKAPEKKFAARHAYLNEPLRLKACVKCHSEKAGRSDLRRQHFMPIRFLVENKLMPPSGASLSETERKELETFLGAL